MTFLRVVLLASLLGTTARAATLPGFRMMPLATSDGFASSVAADSHGVVYFTTTDGWIHRVDGGVATRIASLPTHAGGNGGLLGMTLLDDTTAVVHYTTWNGNDELSRVLDDVISRVDLTTGAETVLHTFVCDINYRPNGASSEHHGGNPALGPDRSVFVGIGEYGGGIIAQRPEWNGGKIWKIDADGNATQWALGVRNPYDVAWDPELGRVIVGDNGAQAGDELNVVPQGSNLGWPHTYGNQPPYEGALPPAYVFPTTVAPTGLLRLSGANAMLRRGYLSGAFVTSSLYYFPTLTASPVGDPIPIVSDFEHYVIDVAEGGNGDIVVATAGWTGTTVYRLVPPSRGDCNGDGATDWRDVLPLLRETEDGEVRATERAQEGEYAGSWGCDANLDGLIDTADLRALSLIINSRQRSAGRR